jgi:hypothetical protein
MTINTGGRASDASGVARPGRPPARGRYPQIAHHEDVPA